MIVLGIDPGTAVTGYGVVQGNGAAVPKLIECGVIRTRSRAPLASRLVLAPGGSVVFAFSGGAETPIYVPPERLRGELEHRGFTDFAAFETGRGTAFLARKPDRH